MYTCPECKEKVMSKSNDRYHCPLCLRTYRLDVHRRKYVMVKKTNN